jgi:hypothetical protein
MAKGKVLTVQRTIYLTKEMYTQLDQLAVRRGQGCKANDLVREALRAFLDEQAEVMASRRHFQKTFQSRIDQFEANTLQAHNTLLFYLNILIQLLAFGLAHILTAAGRTQVTPRQLIQRAVIEARKEETVFAEQVQAVRDMAIQKQP